MNWQELKKILDKTNESFEDFVKRTNMSLAEFRKVSEERMAEMQERIEDLESKGKQPGRSPKSTDTGSVMQSGWLDPKTGEPVPVFSHKDKLSIVMPNKTGVTLGQWLYSKIVGDRAQLSSEVREAIKALATSPDGSGGYTVPEALSSEWIDVLRDALVLSRAGARTVPMPSKTLALAKVVSDPVVAWKVENAAINSSDPTFGVVTLDAKTCVGLVKFSLELSQDSINIQDILVRTLTSAAAAAIDQAGLMGAGGTEPSGVINYSGRQQVTGVGTITSYDPWVDAMGALLAANVPLERIGASIMGTDVWTALAKLKTGLSGDKTPLVRPAALQNVPFLPTNAVPTSGGSPQDGTVFMADWGDLLFGVRKDITIQVIREAFLGTNLQLAILVYARVDFQPAREASFVTLEDVAA